MNKTILERFAEKYEIDPDTGCWNWTGAKSSFGHGSLRVSGKSLGAHRISWELHCGEIPLKMEICHHCDNPKCVNPDHLFLGTHQDNIRDMATKGRGGKTRGEATNTAQLTEAIILEIRHSYKMNVSIYGCHTISKLAEYFGVPSSTIRKIVTRNTWKHI